MEKTKVYITLCNGSTCYNFRNEKTVYELTENNGSPVYKRKTKKTWYTHEKQIVVVNKSGNKGIRNIKEKDSVSFVPYNKEHVEKVITDTATAVINELSPLFVYVSLRTVYANTCNDKILQMMNECKAITAHTDTNKEEYEQTISTGDTITSFYSGYDVEYEFKKAQSEYKQQAVEYNKQVEQYAEKVKAYPAKVESVKKEIEKWHNEHGTTATKEEIEKVVSMIEKPVAPVAPVAPKKSTFEKRAKARDKRNEKEIASANNRETTRTRTTTYKYVDVDGKRTRIETIPETITENTKYGSVVDSETDLIFDCDVADLIQESKLAILELIDCGLVNSVQDVFAFSSYVYRKINNFINAQKKHNVNGRHESIFTVDENGNENIIPVPVIDKEIENVVSKDVILTVSSCIKNNLDKRSNKENVLKVFYMSYVNGLQNKEIAEKLSVSEMAITKYQKQIEKVLTSAELKEKLSVLLFG